MGALLEALRFFDASRSTLVQCNGCWAVKEVCLVHSEKQNRFGRVNSSLDA